MFTCTYIYIKIYLYIYLLLYIFIYIPPPEFFFPDSATRREQGGSAK